MDKQNTTMPKRVTAEMLRKKRYSQTNNTKTKKIKLPFGWPLYIFNCEREELNKEAKKLQTVFTFDTDQHKVNGFTEFVKQDSPREDFFAIWINSKQDDCDYLLLHELIHVVDSYCSHLGIRDNEFTAYLFEDICRKLKLFKPEESKK